MSMEEFPAAELELCEAPILHFFSQSHWEELLQLIKELHKCSSNENFEEIAKLEVT